jgi:hypothetical protein
MKKPQRFTIEKKLFAQVRFYETLYLVKDAKGERVYTGSKETARKVQRVLNGSEPGKWEGRTTLARAKAVSKARKRTRSRS